VEWFQLKEPKEKYLPKQAAMEEDALFSTGETEE